MHNIVYITDDNYILPTKASINSIVQNVTSTDICVNVICVEVTEKNQQAIKNLASKNIKINILNFGNDYNDLGENHHYVSKAALFKFQLPEIFKDLDNILYIDGDIIVSSSMIEVFNFDITEYYSAVVQDLLACSMSFDKKLGHEKYFNSGMMYLNLKKMREENITQKLIEYKKNDTDKSFMDQNALNAVIGENCLWISPKFNMMATCSPKTISDIFQTKNPIQKMSDFYEISESEMQSAWKNPAILHVTSETKAWKNVNAARIDEWIQYSLKDDMLKVAKNYIVSLKLDFERQHGEMIQKFTEQECRIEALRNENAELNSKISALQQALAELHGLILNTRHRTLYGALEFLWQKFFKK